MNAWDTLKVDVSALARDDPVGLPKKNKAVCILII